MKDFDDIYLQQRYLEIIKESPSVGGKSFEELLDYREYRISSAQNSIENDEYIEEFQKYGIKLNIYKVTGSEYSEYKFISQEPEIRCYFILKEQDGGVFNGGVWQRKESYGLAILLVFEYILKKWDFFVSDSFQYMEGQKFWRKLLDQAEKENYKVGVINRISGKEIDYREIDYLKYHGRDNYFGNFLLKIYSKKI